jgi:hypothetical protein
MIPGFESSDAGDAIDDVDAFVTEDAARRPGHIARKPIRDVRGTIKLIFRLQLLFHRPYEQSGAEPLHHLSEENQKCPRVHLRSPRKKFNRLSTNAHYLKLQSGNLSARQADAEQLDTRDGGRDCRNRVYGWYPL